MARDNFVRAGLAVILGAAMFAAGCAGTRPMHYYTLTPATPPAHNSKLDGPLILVGNITSPEWLQDARIHYRSGANEVGAYEYHRWTERPSNMVRDALVRTLRSSGQYQRVMESSSGTIGDYLIHGKLYQFTEVDNPSIQTKISLHLELVDKKTGRNIWDHRFDHEEPSSGKDMRDVVASMDRNLQAVVNEASTAINQALPAKR